MTLEVSDPTAAANADANGGTTHADDEVVQSLNKRINARRVRVDALREELDALEPELKRYERALALLTGEAPQRRTPGPKPGYKRSPRGGGTRMSDERLERIKTVILEYARDHEEFRQVDIRAAVGEAASDDPGVARSSIMATAFETLRQQSVIRMARREGNNKWFRLTREAQRELEQ